MAADGAGRIGVALTAIALVAGGVSFVATTAARDAEAIQNLRAQLAAMAADVRALRDDVQALAGEVSRLSALAERPKPRTTPTKR